MGGARQAASGAPLCGVPWVRLSVRSCVCSERLDCSRPACRCRQAVSRVSESSLYNQQLYLSVCVRCRYELGYRAEFLWQGTSDFTAWLAAPACLAVQHALRTQAITAYNHSLCREACRYLQEAWATSLALGISADGSTAGLVAIELPWPLDIRCSSAAAAPHVAVNGMLAGSTGDGQQPGTGPSQADAAALNLLLRRQHKIEVPVACVAGTLFVRISAQIYNSMDDYIRLRDVVSGLRPRAPT